MSDTVAMFIVTRQPKRAKNYGCAVACSIVALASSRVGWLAVPEVIKVSHGKYGMLFRHV